jgi:arabinogalactan oligomer / maltooligosaccharide transport system permease protein
MDKPAPDLRLRFGIGALLAALVFGVLAPNFGADAARRASAEGRERAAVIALGALADLLAAAPDGDAARKAAADWLARNPTIASLRLAKGMELEISAGGGDTGEKAAPRRLVREEKPLFDRGQRLASSVLSNQDEGGGKEEIEIARLASAEGSSLSVATPLEGGGVLEVVTKPVRAPLAAPYGEAAAALLAALLVVLGAATLLRQQRLVVAVIALAALLGAEAWVMRANLSGLRGKVEAWAGVLSQTAQEEARILPQSAAAAGYQLAALSPGGWDRDAFRKPRALLTPAGALDEGQLATVQAATGFQLRRALYTASLLSVALLLLGGFGALAALGSALVRHRQAYFYIAPAIFGMLVLVFYPFSYGITLSFTDSNIYNTAKPITDIWVGLKNYGTILGDFKVLTPVEGGFAISYENFYWTLIFTVLWTVTNVSIGVTGGLILALILNTKDLAFRPIYRVLLILPWAMPNYITALIWKGMFHRQFGVINQVLQMFGLQAVNWFDKPFTSFLTALATNGWLSFPFMMVVSLGALQSIPADLYEAARVDGATRWQAFKAITLPSLRPALVPAIILSVVWTFNMFNIIYLVTAGEPGHSTEILVTQAYKYAFEKYRYGYAAAYSTVIFGILLVYGSIQNRLSKATEA